jgi:hypothetical protein
MAFRRDVRRPEVAREPHGCLAADEVTQQLGSQRHVLKRCS